MDQATHHSMTPHMMMDIHQTAALSLPTTIMAHPAQPQDTILIPEEVATEIMVMATKQSLPHPAPGVRQDQLRGPTHTLARLRVAIEAAETDNCHSWSDS